jgi:predicted NodU family carbamoyl transferase
MRATTTAWHLCDTDINLNDYDWFMCLIISRSIPSSHFCYKMGEYKTAGLCSWKQNQSKNELDAWENESYTWKRYQSHNKKVQFLEKLFQAGYSTHINFSPTIYHDKKTEQPKNSSTSLTTKYQRSLNKLVSNVFLTHNANLQNKFGKGL